MSLPPPELARLYDEHARALFAFLLDFTGSEADARDLLQELFVRLARSGELPAEVLNERAYLIRMVHRQAIDASRRRQARQRKHDAFGAEACPLVGVTEVGEPEIERAIRAALAELPEEQRAVFHLKTWGGMTFEQIAETLKIPANTAASRYRYALDKMRALLRPLYNEIHE